MRIEAAKITRFRLQLSVPLTTARGPHSVREGILLELVSENGLSGWGESMPLAGFGTESIDEAWRALSAIAHSLLGRGGRSLDAHLDEVDEIASAQPSARAAADSALHDLAARHQGITISQLLALDSEHEPKKRVEVNAVLPIEPPVQTARRATDAVAEGFRTLKLKVGAEELKEDEARVAAVRKSVGPSIRIRLDANGAWSEADAQRFMVRLAPFDIEFLEQPIAGDSAACFARLRANAPLPIAADESASGRPGADALVAEKAVDLLILKPAALGGLRASWRTAARARAANIGVVVTSFLDSAIGVTGALQLTAALPGPLPAAGLATGGWLARDLATAPRASSGFIKLPDSSGLGVTPDRRSIAGASTGKCVEL